VREKDAGKRKTKTARRNESTNKIMVYTLRKQKKRTVEQKSR